MRYQSTSFGQPVFVRFKDRSGRLAAVDLFLPAVEGSLDANLLRRLPLGRIESWVNADRQIADVVRLDTYGPDLRTAAAYYCTSIGDEGPDADSWVADMIYRRRQPSTQPLAEPIKARPAAPDLHLDVPAVRPFGDDFYKAVAAVWRSAVSVYRSPAGAVADANRVTVSQVHRWVKIARERGFLEVGRSGKA